MFDDKSNKWRDPNFQVKIQQDGARPHTSGKFFQLWDNLLISLEMEGVLPSVNKIKLLTQPANLPDMNLNDNGLFNALQATYKRYAPRNAREMIDAVMDVWKKYPPKKINHMWLTLQTNFDDIIQHGGDNNYKIRHLNKNKLERMGSLPTVISVSPEAKAVIVDEAMTGDFDEPGEETQAFHAELEAQLPGYEPPEAFTHEALEDLREEEAEECLEGNKEN